MWAWQLTWIGHFLLVIMKEHKLLSRPIILRTRRALFWFSRSSNLYWSMHLATPPEEVIEVSTDGSVRVVHKMVRSRSHSSSQRGQLSLLTARRKAITGSKKGSKCWEKKSGPPIKGDDMLLTKARSKSAEWTRLIQWMLEICSEAKMRRSQIHCQQSRALMPRRTWRRRSQAQSSKKAEKVANRSPPEKLWE